MKKLFLSICILIIVLAAAFGGLLFAYTQSEDYTSDKFPTGYSINDVDCSGLTYDEAKKKLADGWNHKTLTIVDEDGQQLGTFTNFGCTYNITDTVSTIKHDNLLMSALNHYSKAPVNANMKMAIKACGNSFRDKLMDAPFLNVAGATETTDAYVDTSDPGFPIISEVYGTNVDKDKFFNSVIQTLSSGSLTMTFVPEDYAAVPNVHADDASILAYQKLCQGLTERITYELGDETFSIPVADMANMYNTDGSGKVNEDAVIAYVKKLGKTYDNVGAKRTFTTLSGNEISIKGGTEGWTIDQDGEFKQLVKDLESSETVSRKPVFSQEGYGEYTRTVGYTYIEANLTKQEVHVWIKGEDKFHCNFVSGDKSKGKSTPEGFWFIKNKLRDVTMKGTNADGSKYEVPAEYWMGITPNGIGFHDSNWRTEFGGDIWKTNGSHGCLNMPKDKIPKMFKVVKVGMPVVMYY